MEKTKKNFLINEIIKLQERGYKMKKFNKVAEIKDLQKVTIHQLEWLFETTKNIVNR